MDEERKSLRAVLSALPACDAAAVRYACRQAGKNFHGKLVVLDDDPTGVQTVHDVFVYTDWSAATLTEAFRAENDMFYVLTNSRGLSAVETAALHREIGQNLAAASRAAGRDFVLISRSDSTLRGHYPLETEVLRRTLEAEQGVVFDGEIMMPFFPEGGRYTVGGVHYVASGDELIPAGQTEFARDKTFGYHSSSLPAWIEEKTEGRCRREDVLCISLDRLRRGDVAGITDALLGVRGFGKVAVDAVDYCDVRVFVTALLGALARGRRFLFRTAAALPKVLGGVEDRPLLTARELVPDGSRNGGLVVVGSHVAKTTEQLRQLLALPGLCPLEFNQHLVVDEAALEAETARVAAAAEEAVRAGRTAVVYTRRERLDVGGGPEEELRLAVRISDAVTDLVRRFSVRPAWIIAKGGITSSEIGVKGLGVRRALVLGQVLPGIPVWRTGPESRFPGLSYLIFPGNVGGPDALARVVGELAGGRA